MRLSRPSACARRSATPCAAGRRSRYLEEEFPLGTAGPVRLAADEDLLGDRFMVLNGDVLSDLDLTALQRQHADTGAVATLALHPVDDPTSYGLVRRDPEGAVLGFLEKPDPAEIDTDEVNAGAYVLERRVLDLIPAGRAVSIEREIFPRLVGDGLYGRRLEGYWMDIGTPERYLQASWDILDGTVATELPGDGGPFIAERAEVAGDATVEPRAVVRSGCRVASRAAVADSVLLDGCRIGAGAEVHGAILAAEVEVGAGATVAAGSVIGERAHIAPGAVVGPGSRVQPDDVVDAEVLL